MIDGLASNNAINTVRALGCAGTNWQGVNMRNMTSKSPSRIEIAKALRQFKALTTTDQYKRISTIVAESMTDTPDDAVEGLSQEDEFVMLCVLMGTSTHLAPLEQRPSIATGIMAPDLLARFQPPYDDHSGTRYPTSRHGGYRCLVEVKSTTNAKFKIGGQPLDRLRQFAKSFDLPLVFAVRFVGFPQAALWSIVEDANPNRNSLTVGVGDLVTGLRPVIWNDHGYMLIPGTYLQVTYDSNTQDEGVTNPRYGTQVALQIVTHQSRFAVSKQDITTAGAFFESYGLKETQVQSKGTKTNVIYVPQQTMLTVADLIFAMNRLARDDDGNLVHEPGRALRELADGHSPLLIKRQLVEFVANRMCQIGALVLMGLGNPGDGLKIWHGTGGR